MADKQIPKYEDMLYTDDKINFGLDETDYWWIKHQPWLEERGYMLRPRFRPGWVPSWLGIKKYEVDCEDGQVSMICMVMDAVRKSDGQVVAIKKLDKSVHPYEVEITSLFSTEPLASDPRNHSVPVLEVLQSPIEPEWAFIVLPYLVVYREIRFATIGEAVACFQQLFEGLEFIHEQHVAHRDVGRFNVMMDLSIFPEAPNPVTVSRSYDFKRRVRPWTRTSRPPKYYIIDFGLSRRYAPTEVCPWETIILGGDKTVPEHKDQRIPQNPFWTDIYYLGNMIREDFMQSCFGFDFMKPLIADMVQDDPSERPSIEEAKARFEEIKDSLSWWKLRSRVVYRKDWSITGFYRACRHVVRTGVWLATGKRAVPLP